MDDQDTPTPPTPVCYRHADRATRLACSECGKPICADCSHDSAVGQRCPDCAKPHGRNRVVSSRELQQTSFATTPVTFTLIGISVVLFAAGFVSTELDLRLTEYLSLGEFVRQDGFLFIAEMRDVDPWRVLTSAFLHANITHILFNMYALYLFGPRLERQAGAVPYALTYGASAAAGGAVFIALRTGEATLAVGASGAVFGLFGMWLVAAYRMRGNPAGRAMFNQLAVLLAINGALPFFIRNIAWEAHVGGLVAGVVIGFLWGQFAAGRPNAVRIRTIISGAVFVIAMAVVILL